MIIYKWLPVKQTYLDSDNKIIRIITDGIYRFITFLNKIQLFNLAKAFEASKSIV